MRGKPAPRDAVPGLTAREDPMHRSLHRILFAMTFALACPALPAKADQHTCDQLRASVEASLPAIARDLPYDRLDCAGISEVYLLLMRFDGTAFMLNQRIEAIFRRYGLVR
jgi:hypothetical protein